MRKLTKAQEEEIIKMYQDDRSVHAIAAKLNVDYDEVWDLLLGKNVVLIRPKEQEIIKLHNEGLSNHAIGTKLSIKPERVWRVLRSKGVGKLTKEQEEEMARLYKEGLSVGAIAPKFSVRRERVWHILRRKGVKTRPRIEAVNKALTIYSFNVNYFDVIDTEEKAYWIGFIMADGNVYHKKGTAYYRFSMGLKTTDMGHLVKLRAALNSTHQIYTDNRPIPRLDFSNEYFCKTLIKHGIVPRKSYKELVPPQMPNELLRHFWRGYFDGDGSLYTTKNMNAKYGKSWGFTLLGSHTLLESFIGWAWSQELLVRRPTLHRVRPNSKTFEVKLRRESEVRNATQALYEGATVSLDRKMEKYLELKSSEVKDGQLKLYPHNASKT